ncbi:MAG: hypothetical protein KC503_06525 [Myxococcales bacterium]|nr:hypothetical protein [Myxococcales bacterium]
MERAAAALSCAHCQRVVEGAQAGPCRACGGLRCAACGEHGVASCRQPAPWRWRLPDPGACVVQIGGGGRYVAYLSARRVYVADLARARRVDDLDYASKQTYQRLRAAQREPRMALLSGPELLTLAQRGDDDQPMTTGATLWGVYHSKRLRGMGEWWGYQPGLVGLAAQAGDGRAVFGVANEVLLRFDLADVRVLRRAAPAGTRRLPLACDPAGRLALLCGSAQRLELRCGPFEGDVDDEKQPLALETLCTVEGRPRWFSFAADALAVLVHPPYEDEVLLRVYRRAGDGRYEEQHAIALGFMGTPAFCSLDASISADGRQVALCLDRRRVAVVDLASGSEVAHRAFDSDVDVVRFCADRLLVCADDVVWCWYLRAGLLQPEPRDSEPWEAPAR